MANAIQQINTTDTLSYLYSQHSLTPLQYIHGSQNNQDLEPETRDLNPIQEKVRLGKVLSYLYKEGKEIILLGDTNCDLPTKQSEQPIDTKHMTGLYELFSFKQVIEEPTSTGSSITCLKFDHFEYLFYHPSCRNNMCQEHC